MVVVVVGVSSGGLVEGLVVRRRLCEAATDLCTGRAAVRVKERREPYKARERQAITLAQCWTAPQE